MCVTDTSVLSFPFQKIQYEAEAEVNLMQAGNEKGKKGRQHLFCFVNFTRVEYTMQQPLITFPWILMR